VDDNEYIERAANACSGLTAPQIHEVIALMLWIAYYRREAGYVSKKGSLNRRFMETCAPRQTSDDLRKHAPPDDLSL
jgi:hypothetical protein